MRIKLNSGNGWRIRSGLLVLGAILALALFPAHFGYCDDVDLATARLVAESSLKRHVVLYGDWNGVPSPTVSSGKAVTYNGAVVAYNFQILPSGHVLVAADDYLSPVLLYSTRSSFEPARVQHADAIESWIIPEVKKQVEAVKAIRLSGAIRSNSLSDSDPSRRIADAWVAHTTSDFNEISRNLTTATADTSEESRAASVRTASVAPLLTTTWGQSDPYNYLAPSISPADPAGCTYALTGCVATAWAQLLRYWSWPIQGTGSYNYTWYDDFGDSHTESGNYDIAYDWLSMLDDYGSGYATGERTAVAELMYHIGVAAEMEFGCDGSGSGAYADEVLDDHFYYKSTMNRYERSSFSAADWFSLIQTELDADPPRPVVFSIFGPGGGHEVIIDGYRTAPDSLTDMVHINYGWEGYEDGFYNVTSDFSAGGYTWWGSFQDIVTGIEPENTPPIVDAGIDQTVDEEIPVQLSGSATDPENVGVSSYLWTQTSGPVVTLSDSSIVNPIFTPPNVHSETALIFQMRADDGNRAWAVDTCTITVTNTDGSSAPVADAGADQTVAEETVVDLIGSATDPNGAGITSYLWTQLSGPSISLSDAATTAASFTAPNVGNETTMIFRFRAGYGDGDSATDTCTVMVNNTDGSVAHVSKPSSGSGGGGGGCFISQLR